MIFQLSYTVLKLHYNDMVTLEVYDRIMIFQLSNAVLTLYYNKMVTLEVHVYDWIMIFQLGNTVMTLYYNNMLTLEVHVYDWIMIFQLGNTVMTLYYNNILTLEVYDKIMILFDRSSSFSLLIPLSDNRDTIVVRLFDKCSSPSNGSVRKASSSTVCIPQNDICRTFNDVRFLKS